MYKNLGLEKEPSEVSINGNIISINDDQIKIVIGTGNSSSLTINNSNKPIEITKNWQDIAWEEIYYYTFDFFNDGEKAAVEEKINKLLKEVKEKWNKQNQIS